VIQSASKAPSGVKQLLRGNGLIVALFLGMAVVKLFVAFAVLPSVTGALGSNYHGDLFPDDYDLIAENIVAGHGYRVYVDTSETMLRSPGFVLPLAFIFLLAGKSLLVVQVIQSFMSILTSVFVYLIARRLLDSRIGSVLAAAVFLFHPVSLLSDTRGGVDTTLTLCLTATLWLLLRALETERLRDYVLCGLVLGYTMLVKASVALIFPFVFLYLVVRGQSRFTAVFRNFAIMAVMAALVMAPWVARNYAISGRFVPTMTVAGLALFQGEQVQKYSGSGKDSWELLDDAANEQLRIGDEMGLRMHKDFFPQFYRVTDEIDFYGELSRRAWADYRAQPMLLLQAVVHNSWAFWFQGRTAKATMLNMAIMVPFLALSLYGAFRVVPRNPVGWLLLIAVITYMLPHLVIISVARYSSAVIPILSVFVAGVWFTARTNPQPFPAAGR
jgi:4-amino-4-deoxy-L-arabinose transferase-like glycosyltransferase